MRYPQYFINDLKSRANVALIITALILLIIFVIDGVAQEKPKAVGIDEFGHIGCDDMLARIDNFYTQLRSNPTAKGLVVITGSRENLIRKIQLEILFTSGVIQRRMDSSRVTIVRGAEVGEAMMYFWLVPRDTNESERAVKPWDMKIPKGTKPFYFYSNNDSVCIYPTVHRSLKELLLANPKLRVNIVVNINKSGEFRRTSRETRDMIGLGNSSRIRFFQVRDRSPDSLIDYWILP